MILLDYHPCGYISTTVNDLSECIIYHGSYPWPRLPLCPGRGGRLTVGSSCVILSLMGRMVSWFSMVKSSVNVHLLIKYIKRKKAP